MASFETLHFNPAAFESVEGVRDHALEMMQMKGYVTRDFSCCVRPGDFDLLVLQTIQPTIDYAWELVSRGAGKYLCWPEDQVRALVKRYFSGNAADNRQDFDIVMAEIPKGYDLACTMHEKRVAEATRFHSPCFTAKPDPGDYDAGLLADSKKGLTKISLKAASIFYQRVETEMYVKSMELNYLDYRSRVPDSPCTHDMAHVLKRFENPDYELTEDDRTIHFATHRAQSFGILVGMASREVTEKVLLDRDAILAGANLYNSLKDTFAIASETVAQMAKDDEPSLPTVRLGSELDGLKM